MRLACKESRDPMLGEIPLHILYIIYCAYYRYAGIAVCSADLDSIRLGFSSCSGSHVEAQIALLKCERR